MQEPLILRPLDPGEAFFHMSDQVSCMNFVVFAERSGACQTERIRHALDRVQLENTLLQTGIQWTVHDGLCFAHAPGARIELRCHQVTMDDWQSCIEQQLSEPFAEGVAPLMRCLYLEMSDTTATAQSASECAHTPTRSVLALCFHHAIADGRSGTELLRRMLALMAGDTVPRESASPTLLPAMAEVHPSQYRWAEQADTAKQLKGALISDYRRHGPLPAISWLASESTQRTPKFIRLSFTPEVTHRLIVAARENRTTVHGLLCAAQLLAQLNLQPVSEPVAFFLSCPVDMRPHLEPMPAASPTGLFVSLISATFSISVCTDVWDLAREVITQTRLQIARGEGHLFFSLYGLDGSPVLPDRLASFRQKALASLPNTMVSNVGPIATVAQDPAVESISFALCPMPYQTLFTAASSYGGRLILNMGFDAARITSATATQLSENLQQILLTTAE